MSKIKGENKNKLKNKTKTNASYRLFMLLEFLLNNPSTIHEISDFLQRLNNDEKEYSLITVYKYLNSLKTLGVILKKKGDKFHLIKLPFCLKFTKEQLLGLKIVERCCKNALELKARDDIEALTNRLFPNLSKMSMDYYNHIKIREDFSPRKFSEKEKKLISDFEKFNEDGLKVSITYLESLLEEKTVLVELIDIYYKENRVFFNVYDSLKGQIMSIPIKSIVSMEETPQKIKGVYMPISVTYKIMGGLNLRYSLRNHEKVAEVAKDYSIIVNRGEDKKVLIRRLIGYFNSCELLSPKEFREDMINELDKMLKNYEQQE